MHRALLQESLEWKTFPIIVGQNKTGTEWVVFKAGYWLRCGRLKLSRKPHAHKTHNLERVLFFFSKFYKLPSCQGHFQSESECLKVHRKSAPIGTLDIRRALSHTRALSHDDPYPGIQERWCRKWSMWRVTVGHFLLCGFRGGQPKPLLG